MTPGRPPRLAAWILGLLTPPGLRQEVLGDLEESYGLYFEQYGRWHARRWYWAQACVTPVWLLWEETETMMGMSWQEARMAVRGFLRRPGFSAITVLSLSLALGATYSSVKGGTVRMGVRVQ